MRHETYAEFNQRMEALKLNNNPASTNRSTNGVLPSSESSSIFEAEKLNAEYELAKAEARLALAEIRVAEKSAEQLEENFEEDFSAFGDNALDVQFFDEDFSADCFDENEIDEYDEETQSYEENDFDDDDF